MVIYSPAISGKYTYFVEVQIRYDRSQHQQSRRAMNKSNLEKKKKMSKARGTDVKNTLGRENARDIARKLVRR